jgi:hypothetical protein
MTEASIDGIALTKPKLKSDSRLVILLGLPEGIKDTSKKLMTLDGVERVRKGLFIVQGYSESHEAILQSQSFVSFIKTREIPKTRKRPEDAYSDRVFSVVSFSYISPTAQQKKRVERLIRKTTGIRLRPGVILFPLLRAKEQRRVLGPEDERILLDSRDFSRLIRENGGIALRWTRLRIINLDGANHLKHAFEQTLSRDLTRLEEKIRILREMSRDITIPIMNVKKNYTILSRRFRELKTKWMTARELWFYDAEKDLRRTYNMLITTRRAIVSEEARREG